MAELIIYAGRFDPEFLSRAHEAQDRSGASQPAGGPAVQAQLKRAAATAKLDYRKTCILRRRVDQGQVEERDLAWWEQENLRKLEESSSRCCCCCCCCCWLPGGSLDSVSFWGGPGPDCV